MLKNYYAVIYLLGKNYEINAFIKKKIKPPECIMHEKLISIAISLTSEQLPLNTWF